MDIKVTPHLKFKGVYQVTLEDGSYKLATMNLSSGRNVYKERLVIYGDAEYRLWDPFRSKLAAVILKGLDSLHIKPGDKVLYLGAASGTTASHVSDIVGEKGDVFCVEFAPRSIRELIDNVCKFRPNIVPILADARNPRKYTMLVGKVDAIYCDVAQPEQALILVNNAEVFLRRDGWGILAVKARSIDVTKDPQEIFRREVKVLKDNGFKILEVINLEPYDKDHVMVNAEYIARGNV